MSEKNWPYNGEIIVGTIVHFYPAEIHVREAIPIAAIITYVAEDAAVHLSAVDREGFDSHWEVPYSPTPKVGHWSTAMPPSTVRYLQRTTTQENS